jgi:hypothetical protein
MMKAAIFKLVSFYPDSRSPLILLCRRRLRHIFRHNALLTLFASCFPLQCTVDVTDVACVISFPREINWQIAYTVVKFLLVSSVSKVAG